MITRSEADGLRAQLLAVLAEDAQNAARLVARLDAITEESGIGARSALLLILTHLAFDEQDACRHWDAVMAHRDEMSRRLGRDAGIRVTVLDYFTNVNRSLVHPTLIDLEMYDSVQEEAGTDPLTGLASDRRFRSALSAELNRAHRYRQRVSVVVVDADEFGVANRRFGRLVGDRLLRELAVLLGKAVRDIDLAARAGEDEMVVLLPETERNGALLVAERFRGQVESFFADRESAGEIVGLTVSAGVACYPVDAKTPETLLERAAQALYHAKATGRNVVHPYRPEKRRFLRFDLDPDRCEIEVLAPADRAGARPRNLSRNGILFTSPEALEVGEPIELRLAETGGPREVFGLRVRGRVVRLEEVPVAGPVAGVGGEGNALADGRYEVGVALDGDPASATDELMDFIGRAAHPSVNHRS